MVESHTNKTTIIIEIRIVITVRSIIEIVIGKLVIHSKYFLWIYFLFVILKEILFFERHLHFICNVAIKSKFTAETIL